MFQLVYCVPFVCVSRAHVSQTNIHYNESELRFDFMCSHRHVVNVFV